jgi:hypothetical protein
MEGIDSGSAGRRRCVRAHHKFFNYAGNSVAGFFSSIPNLIQNTELFDKVFLLKIATGNISGSRRYSVISRVNF